MENFFKLRHFTSYWFPVAPLDFIYCNVGKLYLKKGKFKVLILVDKS